MNKKSHFEQPTPGGAQPRGGFDFYDFKQALAAEYGERSAEFFAAAFRQLSGELLTQTNKYTRLVDWMDKEIRNAGGLINAFSPAAKMDDYTQAQALLWREQVHYIAELVYFRGILLDNRTSNQERQNVEYTVCKLYGIRYNEYLEDYV